MRIHKITRALTAVGVLALCFSLMINSTKAADYRTLIDTGKVDFWEEYKFTNRLRFIPICFYDNCVKAENKDSISEVGSEFDKTLNSETESYGDDRSNNGNLSKSGYNIKYTYKTGELTIDDLENSGRNLIVYGDIPYTEMIRLENILKSYDKNISLAVYSLDGTKGLMYNGNQTYFSACTIKIAWALHLCQGIDSGKYNKDDVLTYLERHWYNGSGSIRWGSYGDTYTIEELINLSISISDNVAYRMLMEYTDMKGFNQFTKELGYETFLPENRIMWSMKARVKDYIGIWNEVYEYFESGTAGSEILKNACTNTKWAWGLQTLPDGLDYSHKSGDNCYPNAARNDAGIVWGDVPYIYAVFSKCDGQPNDIKVMNDAMSIVHEVFGN